ncbi:MAG TPA: hypothetical protein VGQ42_06230 [Candidatus Dormibacteraeota bacterium]|nr:hypothetical protein [Candidatus Dormibacteraeota bacterium]
MAAATLYDEDARAVAGLVRGQGIVYVACPRSPWPRERARSAVRWLPCRRRPAPPP